MNQEIASSGDASTTEQKNTVPPLSADPPRNDIKGSDLCSP
jgi:hypothetical protein